MCTQVYLYHERQQALVAKESEMDRSEMRLAITRALSEDDKVMGELVHLSNSPHDFTYSEVSKIAKNAYDTIQLLQTELGKYA